ncbi:MAG: response regulator [Microcystaceae cyanobacterium]
MTQPSDLSNYSMFDLFSMEVESQGQILSDHLLSLEKQLQSDQIPPSSKTLPILEALMRAAHSLKGAARIVQLDRAVRIAHVMEDYFVAVMDQAIALQSFQIDRLLQGVDFLVSLSKVEEKDLDQWLTNHHDQSEQVVAGIASLLQRRKSDRSSSSPPHDNPPSSPPSDELSLDEVFPEVDDSYIELASEFITSETTVLDVAPISAISTPFSPPSPPSEDFTPKESPDDPDKPSPEPSSPTPEDSLISELAFLSPSSTYNQKKKEGFVRVDTNILHRLMGLAGESLVEATSLAPLADELIALKRHQLDLCKTLEQLYFALEKTEGKGHLKALLLLAQQQERNCRELSSASANTLESFAHRSYNLADNLYRQVIATRMRPFEEGVQGFPRMVRDLAKELKKQVKLQITGHSTLIDRDILNKLEAPLTHILQNALDHGIESPQERQEKGKSPEGLIKLEATHRFGMLLVTVTDDGRGISLDKLRSLILEKNLVTAEMAKRLNETELMEFIFLPSFSTAREVTNLSGRGIGLNVAKTMVQEVGGNLQATSQPNQGMTFHFQLPLTLSVIRTLLVEISGEPYAFPLSRIDHILTLSYEEISSVENRQYYLFNGKNIGLIRADQVLELDSSHLPTDKLSVVILNDTLNQYGLIVDRFLGEKNLVVRPLDPRLGKIQDVASAALLEDGTPVLILDVGDLICSLDKLLNNSHLSRIEPTLEHSWISEKKSILVVDDSITVREMERKILQNHGYKVDVAVDGMDGWNAIQGKTYNLIISDVDMPRLSGLKLVELIKKHPQFKSIPVIIVSYKERESDRLKGIEAGADYYLTKSSFHDDTLIDVVNNLI